ncbi:TonB-dependent receptor [Flavobacterium gilvum]|uniref:TonB-dependent receptor n=1 Tax=Flavobacterium gilvum TaxID=1492737 RepID=A0AAC9I339_9FLAO|nr:TonB-dependent receptor [Flavobacterium gilvum]AOW08587.1 TonB-dependent receptor [Flavobacterium gilvum]KFC58419.1 TonB-denpendent receptor [Flavobacterium gilvum]
MKTMKNWLLSGLLFLMVSTVFSQGKITGTITDGQGPLPGANVTVKGTSEAASTGYDGKFTISSSTKAGQLIVSYIGYQNQTINFTISNGTANLGNIVLVANSNELSEIVVKSSVVDVAKDRKTPVAVSTIKASEIQQKLGTQEFPEILKSTPSVYATKSGGGYGDSRINIRGFDQKNIAVMINGMPINDMENSAVFWSNWAGLSDVTSAMQVQRGLGSSKLAISSVGGTINIVTKTSDQKGGGSIGSSFGNANYLKTQASYSTGVLENGLSASVLFSHTQGDGYIDGTQFAGDNYFIGLGYQTKDKKHDFQFTMTGAPQWHNQRSTFITLATYQKYGTADDPNTKYNSDWGTLNGEEYNMKRNFFHKPVMSVNWDYTINETTKLSAIVYGSWGRGAGTAATGGINGKFSTDASFRKADGTIDFDKIYAYNTGLPIQYNTNGVPTGAFVTRTKINGQYVNSANAGAIANSATGIPGGAPATSAGISRIMSTNEHNWYGGVINLDKKISEHLTWDIGLDARTYFGRHYQNVNDLLGGNIFYDNKNVNFQPQGRYLSETYSAAAPWNAWSNSDNVEKIGFHNDSKVNWIGAFTQMEYSNDNLTAFIQGAVSNQAFQRIDSFIYLTSDPLSKTSFEKILGGNVKGGANYNFDEHHNVFANAGYYSKQPFFNAVYPNNKSVVNPNLKNEKVLGIEGGYGYRSKIVNLNLNYYYTTWKDRNYRFNDGAAGNPNGYFDFEGINEMHTGVELEANSRITNRLRVNGMFSYGNWEYAGEAKSTRFDQNNVALSTSTLYLDKVKVGDAAQLTAALGASYEVLTRVTLDANYNYYNNLYASIDPTKFSAQDNKGSLELPSYGLFDAGFSYKMLVGKNKDNSVNFRFNLNNVFDKTYIAESKTNIFASDNINASNPALGTYESTGQVYNGVATANQVWFGFGRTYSFSMRFDF